MFETVVDALLPATSEQLPDADWFAPSFESVTGPLELATPDVSSVQTNETVTAWLVQSPLVYAFPSAVFATATRCGAALSMLMFATVADAEFPARSLTVPVTD